MVTQEVPVQKKRSIRKVIILGHNRALLAGYLRGAAVNCASYQLYSTLGMGIGVTRYEYEEDCEMTLQLWTLPFRGAPNILVNNFAKGHSGALIVVTPDEVDEFSELLSPLTEESKKSTMIVFVGSIREAEDAAIEFSKALDQEVHVSSVTSIRDSIADFVNSYVGNLSNVEGLPRIVAIPPEECPQFEPNPYAPNAEPPSKEEISYIKEYATASNIPIQSGKAQIAVQKGMAEIVIATGKIEFSPAICKKCIHQCPKKVNLCIIGVDKGWSDGHLGETSLLILAKLHAISTHELPQHVLNQINTACTCEDFQPDPGTFLPNESELYDIYLSLGPCNNRVTLLEEACRRLKDGRLTRDAFDILKKWLIKSPNGDDPCS